MLIQGNNRIAADHAEFNTKTHLGTFYHASGMATVQPPRQIAAARRDRRAARSPVRRPTSYFFGEMIEKIGTKKYKITNGGFSTCVQPTPRWDLTAGTVVLNVDHYTLLRQAIFRVKGVPMLYLPIMYFPTKEDGRATGFLIPTYGVSTPSRPDDSQRVLLGDQPQAGRDVSVRLVLEDRHRRRRRVSLQSGRRHGWPAERLPAG